MITIRPYQAADHQRCMQIFETNIPKYFAVHEHKEFDDFLTAFDTGSRAFKDSKDETYFIIEDDGKIVGCGGYGLWTTVMEASMTWGMVDNSLHKNGYGKALLLYRLDELKRLHPEYKIVLNTSQHTYPFFEKLGFVITKITENGYEIGLHRYDMAQTNN